MGLDRRISGAAGGDLSRSDQGRRKPNRTRIYPPIRGPCPAPPPVVADAALDADRCSGWRRTSPGAVIFFEFFHAGRCHRLPLYNVANVVRRRARLTQAAKPSNDNLQNSNARRCTTFAIASVVVVQR